MKFLFFGKVKYRVRRVSISRLENLFVLHCRVEVPLHGGAILHPGLEQAVLQHAYPHLHPRHLQVRGDNINYFKSEPAIVHQACPPPP